MRWVVGCVLAGSLVAAQNTGRFVELTARGIELVQAGRFNEAINSLEQVWEHDQTDSTVAEHLAMGYLYADVDIQKAFYLTERALALGGRASFFAHHSHERLGLLSGDMAEYCQGRLSLTKGRITFAAEKPEHSFAIVPEQVKEIRPNRGYGSRLGMYHIRTADGKNYNFRPRSWSPEETQLILSLIDKHFRD